MAPADPKAMVGADAELCCCRPMIIRDEQPSDLACIRFVVEHAFASRAEADLVDRLRSDRDAVFSLVALLNDQVVGHVMFSQMIVPFRALGLGPVAVLSEHRRNRIAARLIERGICRAQRDGWEGVFVLGDPNYYHRFGFAAGLAAGFVSRYAGPHFMALALAAGGLPALTGEVGYKRAFDELG
jgi:putative acetyltransferase